MQRRIVWCSKREAEVVWPGVRRRRNFDNFWRGRDRNNIAT